MNVSVNRRVLVIDDNPSIHSDFRKILEAVVSDDTSLAAKAAILFGESAATPEHHGFEIEQAFQGEEGLEKISQARQEGQPFAMAFVDVRMPPGIDGIETIERAFQVDPDLQCVICSAYSDYTSRDLIARLGVSPRLLLLRKPCDAAEILLLAENMCHKWNLAQGMAVCHS